MDLFIFFNIINLNCILYCVIGEQVAELAQDYPYLTSLKSAQLSPSSWLSVAWYFVYTKFDSLLFN
jgi:hypothetical protein